MEQQVKDWCEENGYALVCINRYNLEPHVVYRIAEKATYAKRINERSRKEEVAFARFLACAYLYNYMPHAEIVRELGVSRFIVSYAHNMDLFKTNPKFFKPWQANAVKYFKKTIKEAEEELCKS